MISNGKPILDACCGSRMFWFDKDNPFVEFMDIRDEEVYLSDGQLCIVHPNTIGDFTAMPFPDGSFRLVVFDPPHLVWDGKAANWLQRQLRCLDVNTLPGTMSRRSCRKANRRSASLVKVTSTANITTMSHR